MNASEQSLEIDPIHRQLIFNKGAKAGLRRKDTLFGRCSWNSYTSQAKEEKKRK